MAPDVGTLRPIKGVPPGVTRIPAASFSYGSSSPRHAQHLAPGQSIIHDRHGLSGRVAQPGGQDRNASGPLSAARKERSGKPIMDWLARKLGGGTKRVGSGSGLAESGGPSRVQHASSSSPERRRIAPQSPPLRNGMKLGPRPVSTHHRSTPHTHTRTESLDFALATHQPRSGIAPTFRTRSSASPMSSPAMSRSPSEISLAASFLGIEDPDDRSFVPSSHGNRDHDEDASIRPIAPSHSSSPARSGFHSARSGYRFRGTADGVGHARRSSTSTVESSIRAPSEAGWRSFRSNGAHTTGSATGSGAPSTKPTTVFSIESGAGHMAHIAQDVPHAQQQLQTPIEASAVTAPHGLPRPPSVYRTLTWESGLSGPSHPSPLAITSTADDDAQDAPLTPTIVQSAQVPPPMSSPIQNLRHSLVQAPKHSRHHPRGNPRPDAQPGPNASTLTLASSTFAFSPAPGAGGSVRARSIAENAGAANVLAEGEVSAEDADATTQDRRSLIGTTPPALRLETDTMSSRSPQRDSLVRTRTDQVGTLPTFDAISLRDREHAPSSARGPASAYSTYSKHRMLDDDASIRALRRRGSGESGTSKFSWAAVHSPWVGGDGQAGVTLGQPLVQMAQ